MNHHVGGKAATLADDESLTIVRTGDEIKVGDLVDFYDIGLREYMGRGIDGVPSFALTLKAQVAQAQKRESN
jgi:hypothetical protein